MILNEDVFTKQKQTDLGLFQMITGLVKDEWEAIEGYQSSIATCKAEKREDIVSVLTDILDEENLHVGQLQAILQQLDPATDKIEDGQEEAEQQLNESVDIPYEDISALSETVVKKLSGIRWKSNLNHISKELMDAIKEANNALKKANQLYEDEIGRPEREDKAAKENARLFKNGIVIDLDKDELELVGRVLGQLSDGYWENSPQMEKYWKNIHMRGNNLIVDIDNLKYSSWSERFRNEINTIWNDPEAIRVWFGNKAQIVHNSDMKDNFGTTKLTDEEKDMDARYLDGSINKTYRQIQQVINKLKGKTITEGLIDNKNKNPSPNIELVNYKEISDDGESKTERFIYKIKNKDLLRELNSCTQDELRQFVYDLLNVDEEFNVPAGDVFHRYSIDLNKDLIIVEETTAWNI